MSDSTEIWLDRVARRMGFGWVADRMPVVSSASMALVVTGIFVDTFLLQVTNFALFGREIGFVQNPFVLLGEGGGGLLIAVYGVKQLNRKYENAKTRLQLDRRKGNHEQFDSLAPDRFRWAAWVAAAGLQIAQALFLLGPAEIYRVDGVFGLVGNFFFIPFVYVPVVVEFAVTYFAIQVLLPRRINKSDDLALDFLDPENMGGLRPIGDLLKQSYYYFVLLYVSVALFVYGPELFPGLFYSAFSPGVVVNAGFTVVWVASALLLAYGVYTLHLFMSRAKRREIQRLDQKVKEEVEEPWDVQNFRIPDDGNYDEIRTRMEYVTATKEYPATFTIWSQLLISILIPKAIQLVLNSS